MSLRADRHEAARRLLVGLAPRLRDARARWRSRAEGLTGVGLPDAEPRRVHGRRSSSSSACSTSGATRASSPSTAASPSRSRWHRHRLRGRDALVHRAPGHERLRGRVPHPLGDLALAPAAPRRCSRPWARTASSSARSTCSSWSRGSSSAGSRNPENRDLRDLSVREGFVLVPMIVLIVVMGLLPRPVPRPGEAGGRPARRALPAGRAAPRRGPAGRHRLAGRRRPRGRRGPGAGAPDRPPDRWGSLT